MSIPTSDALSLDLHSHNRRHSQTHSSVPIVSFFSSSPSVQTTKPVEKHSTETVQKTAMSLRHRSPTGATLTSSAPSNGHARSYVQKPASEDSDDGKKEMKDRRAIDWEFPRKFLHSSIGFVVVHLYISHTSPMRVAMVLSASCAVITSVDIVRLRNPHVGVIYEKFLGFLMRESEKRKTNGVIWYLLGCIFVLVFYPQDIAVVSILILSWCDTIASFFGRLYGPRTSPLPQSFTIPFTNIRIPLPFARRKSVAGFLAGASMGSLITFGFWGWLAHLNTTASSLPKAISTFDGPNSQLAVPVLDKLVVISVVTGLFAGIAEAIDIGSLDDNLTLPIISGGVIWALFKCVDYIFS